jgi:glycosyltransferase involved in cell wall biosynthesis
MYAPGPRRSAFIIATRNRPDSLLTTIKSVLAQSSLPAELCIVDASDEASRRAEIEALCADAGLPLDYHHPAPTGLCRQRNVGIDRTQGDPVVFIDDDVRLEPDCHEMLLAEYDRGGPAVGAVCGSDLFVPAPSFLSVLWRRLFGLSTWTPGGTGRMKPSFYVDAISRVEEAKRVEYMNGWLMSCRRSVLEEERFDEGTPRLTAPKDDMDFGYRVSRRYTVIKTPQASGEHFQVASSRLSNHEMAKGRIENQVYLHRKNMPQKLRYRVALWWALVGFTLLNAGKSIVRRDPGYVTGAAAGMLSAARKRLGRSDPAAPSG